MSFVAQFQEWQTKRQAFEAGRVADQREVICNNCEFMVPVGFICRKCGCLLALKVILMQARCPIGKW